MKLHNKDISGFTVTCKWILHNIFVGKQHLIFGCEDINSHESLELIFPKLLLAYVAIICYYLMTNSQYVF